MYNNRMQCVLIPIFLDLVFEIQYKAIKH